MSQMATCDVARNVAAKALPRCGGELERRAAVAAVRQAPAGRVRKNHRRRLRAVLHGDRLAVWPGRHYFVPPCIWR
jgi:hypothetical protein